MDVDVEVDVDGVDDDVSDDTVAIAMMEALCAVTSDGVEECLPCFLS